MFKTAFVGFFAGIMSLGSLLAQDQVKGPLNPLFQSEEILSLDLSADFKTVFSVKDDSTLFPATITVTGNDGVAKTIDIRIRTRGKTRREKDVCRFTPLRLEFPKNETDHTPFEGQKALKLVTHCDKQDFYEQNTIQEYLIYKAYNILTDSSFRVRPAMIRYIYSGEEADTVRKFGFFLEREKHLAERLGGIEIESEKTNPTMLNPFQSCIMDMFQYMIGNTDYSAYDLHNVVLISDSTRRFPPFPIPYDFDWSGLVSANYAVPHPIIGTDHVSERVYRGFKKDPFIVHHTIEVLTARKQEIYEVFENFELLDDKEKEETIKYLEEFFAIINNEKKIQVEFFDNARVIHNKE
ncbi:MAG: hypothetical protein MUC31_08155 [Bacteroidales bacterium]|nr:hypothetical protein [Bacteroidales bacterium]